MRTHGGIPAGGAGRRLGVGVPKALAVLEGRTLLARAVATLREVCDTVTISMSPRRPLPADAREGVETVLDAGASEGALAGLLASITPGDRDWDRALVMGVDFPLARPAALRWLLDRLEGQIAVVPAPGGRMQPFLAVYSRRAFLELSRAFEAGQRSTVAAVAGIGPRVLEDAELEGLPGGLADWLNVNTSEDLAEAARRLRARDLESAA